MRGFLYRVGRTYGLGLDFVDLDLDFPLSAQLLVLSTAGRIGLAARKCGGTPKGTERLPLQIQFLNFCNLHRDNLIPMAIYNLP